MSAPLQLRISGLTDVGRMRERNEDAVAWKEAAGLAVLADGMGGHQGGDVASRVTVERLIASLGDGPAGHGGEQRKVMSRAVTEINRLVYERAAGDASLAGMGSTLVMIQAVGRRLLVAHVGDSRAYRLRRGRLERLTSDHNLFTDLLRRGEAEGGAVDERYRHVLTRAIGVREQVEVEIRALELRSGDIYLLCSDGLHGCVSDAEIGALLQEYAAAPEHAAPALVALANAHGGRDNISVIVAAVDGAVKNDGDVTIASDRQ